MVLDNFDGVSYRLSNNWFDYLSLKDYENRAINYLEIGAYYGANFISVANTYAKNEGSRLYCIDPWEDYNDYSEYKGEQDGIYSKFMANVVS